MSSLLIDNYDSFTYNLAQLMAEVSGQFPTVLRNDQLAGLQPAALPYDCVVISPGPGRPENPRDFGRGSELLQQATVPILGVCLGHQGLAHAYGARITEAPEVMHGRLSRITHTGHPLFAGIPSPCAAVRYHSLVVATPLPACLEPVAWTEEGILMGLAHREKPLWGVQFHPESILTPCGRRLMQNFFRLSREWTGQRGPRGGPSTWSGFTKPATPETQGTPGPKRKRFELHFATLPQQWPAEVLFQELHAAEEPAVWLDSSALIPGFSRYSFMGSLGGPHSFHLSYSLDKQEASLTGPHTAETLQGDFFSCLQRCLGAHNLGDHDCPLPFSGGFIGYLGYELKAACGYTGHYLPSQPAASLLFLDRFLAIDHLERRVYLVCLSPRDEEAAAQAWLRLMAARLERVSALPLAQPQKPPAPLSLSLQRDHHRYLADIARCQELIRRGESYEVCLTNQLEAQLELDPLSYYLNLRRLNPAPYAAYLRCPGLAVACSSPERFLKVDNEGHVEAKPMKGTLHRGATPAEDARLRQALANSCKERAENLMICDLLRNDLGIVCLPGSVHVPQLMAVESYATVHQMVSTIRGRLAPGLGAVDCIKHAFPGGSMTGAPKRRTMEILEGLEQGPRGVYSGAIGYFSLDGAADFNIVIRSAILRNGRFSVGVGGAITALSDPEAEFRETLLKARALLAALYPSQPQLAEKLSIEGTGRLRDWLPGG